MNKLLGSLAGLSMSTALGMAVVVTFIYWSSAYNDGSVILENLDRIENELKEKEKEKKKIDESLAYAKQMQERVGKLSEVFQEISRQLPATLYSVQVNKDIDDFAQRAGVVVKVKTPGVNAIRGIIEEVPYQVTLEGDYLQLAQFVYVVSTAERMARVQNIKITDSEQGHKKLKFDAQVIAYKLAPEVKKATDEKNVRSGASRDGLGD